MEITCTVSQNLDEQSLLSLRMTCVRLGWIADEFAFKAITIVLDPKTIQQNLVNARNTLVYPTLSMRVKIMELVPASTSFANSILDAAMSMGRPTNYPTFLRCSIATITQTCSTSRGLSASLSIVLVLHKGRRSWYERRRLTSAKLGAGNLSIPVHRGLTILSLRWRQIAIVLS